MKAHFQSASQIREHDKETNENLLLRNKYYSNGCFGLRTPYSLAEFLLELRVQGFVTFPLASIETVLAS